MMLNDVHDRPAHPDLTEKVEELTALIAIHDAQLTAITDALVAASAALRLPLPQP